MIKGQTLTVTGEEPKDWKRMLEIFKEGLFGVSKFSKDCMLVNPEVLDFDHDKVNQTFEANAIRPLVFRNMAMGYEVTLQMNQFNMWLPGNQFYSFSSNDGLTSFKKGQLKLNGISRFSELKPESKKQQNKWMKNRKIAYNGSLRHFLISLVNGRIKDEGFEVVGATNYRSSYDYKVRLDTLVKMNPDSISYSLTIPDYLKVTYKKESDAFRLKKLLFPIESSGGDIETIDYYRRRYEMECSVQISYVGIQGGTSIHFDRNGKLMSKYPALVFKGYWNFDGAGEWLPSDYLPID